MISSDVAIFDCGIKSVLLPEDRRCCLSVGSVVAMARCTSMDTFLRADWPRLTSFSTPVSIRRDTLRAIRCTSGNYKHNQQRLTLIVAVRDRHYTASLHFSPRYEPIKCHVWQRCYCAGGALHSTNQFNRYQFHFQFIRRRRKNLQNTPIDSAFNALLADINFNWIYRENINGAA